MIRIAITLILLAGIVPAQAQDGTRGPHYHDRLHGSFYEKLIRKDTKTSCCNLLFILASLFTWWEMLAGQANQAPTKVKTSALNIDKMAMHMLAMPMAATQNWPGAVFSTANIIIPMNIESIVSTAPVIASLKKITILASYRPVVRLNARGGERCRTPPHSGQAL